MKISIITPVYNEINTIAEILKRVKQVNLDKEIIIVDDFSTDGTRQFIESLKDSEIKKVFHQRNLGKGAAFRSGLKEAKGEIVVIQDADLEYYPEEYGELIDLIVKDRADVVYGSRFIGKHRCFLFTHYLGNKLVNLIANILYNTNLSDFMTGAKAFRRSVFEDIKLKSNRFGFEAEITAKIFKRGLRVYEIPICYSGRNYKEGKKITWKDFFVVVYWLIKCRFME
jgi:glycosyltransferase involved in cell wall biosynthesis